MHLRTAAFCLFSLLATAAFAQTTVGSWTMGDNDAGAVSGASVNSTLTAATGSDLTLAGSGLTYTSAIEPQSSGSLAVNFTGAGDYTVGSNLGLSTNFAMEAWVNFSSLATPQWVMLVGDGAGLSIGSGPGVGILLNPGTSMVTGAIAGAGPFASSPVITTGTWYHVALVVDSTGTAQFYFNGNLVTGASATSGFAGNFSIGGDEGGAGLLTGTVDDAKVFTFAPGTFTPSMLNYSAVPEPSTWAAFAGLSVFGLAFWRRAAPDRRRRGKR